MVDFFFFPLLLVILSTFLHGASATLVCHDDSFTPDTVLHISSANISVACAYRESVVVNGSSPGPVVRLTEGKTSWIRVYNDMESNNLTMHWHGLSQRTAPFSDGTPLASQWPIPPNHFFDYEIRPQVGDAGTYFYHSHIGFQAGTCYGPIIVEEASGTPPYKYDEEKVIVVSEFYNKTDATVENGLAQLPMVWSGEPSALLLNGKSPPVAASTNDGTCGPEIITVEPDTKYRLRFIGGTALTLITLGIEDHTNFTIIEADGAYTKPYATDHMQVGSGQRFDVLFKTKSEAELQKTNKTDFYIRMETRDRATQTNSWGVLSYGDGKVTLNTPPKNGTVVLPANSYEWKPEYSLQPLQPNNFPTAEEVTRRVVLNQSQIIYQSRWAVNGHLWSEYLDSPVTPWLVNIYEHGDSVIPSDGYNTSANVYGAKLGEVVEVILFSQPAANNTGYDTHPWHAHGGHVYDIGLGVGEYDADKNEAKLKANGYNGVKRDTTLLYKYPGLQGGWRGWRIRVEDAGVWMVHCHTLQHMIMGLQTVWVMGDAKEIMRDGEPEDMQGYLMYGGNVYGNESWAPTVNHHFG